MFFPPRKGIIAEIVQAPGQSPSEVHEIDILMYGDAYDPTAATRVRDVSSEWTLDSDEDGSKN